MLKAEHESAKHDMIAESLQPVVFSFKSRKLKARSVDGSIAQLVDEQGTVYYQLHWTTLYGMWKKGTWDCHPRYRQ